MKDIVHRVLKEAKTSKEESIEKTIEEIKSNKERIEKFLPKIINFFKSTYENDLHKIEVNVLNQHYGMENFSIDAFEIVFYFNQEPHTKIGVRRDIIYSLQAFFSIDMTRYNTPLSINIYVREWKQL